MTDRAARAVWAALLFASAMLAARALFAWAGAVALRGPVLYGEGAVAHAAILARDRLEYAATSGPIFVAANYPPLYFHLAALGDPFVTGRLESIAATLFVAGAIAWRGRAAGPLVAAAIAIAWLATAPVSIWGPVMKPDLVAMALTVGAVVAIDGKRPPVLAGALAALAVCAKPTAMLPAIALGAYLVRSDRRAALWYVAGAAVGALAVFLPTALPSAEMYRHVVEWNALPWSIDQALPLAIVGIYVAGVSCAFAVIGGGARGAVGAYLVGALGIVVLGGREGSTINYLLDLTAAAALAVASLAPRLRARAFYPALAIAQLALGAVLIDPFGIVPGRAQTTGIWGAPERLDVVRALPQGAALVEDSGLLIAVGREPLVDDVFLWSRIAARGGAFAEGDALLAAVRAGTVVAIVSEADLAKLADAPAYERARWAPSLVSAILDRYRLDRNERGLWVYVPR